MPQYKISVVLSATIETESPELARRIALEGATALLEQDERASEDFSNLFPQQKFPAFYYASESVEDLDNSLGEETSDTPTSADELDKQDEIA
jgi:hypothetical protein